MSTLALFVALGGEAFATTNFVGGNGAVRLCASRNGAAKVLMVLQKCCKGKTQIPVNQTGPQGPAGPQGPPGPSRTPRIVRKREPYDRRRPDAQRQHV